MPINIEYKLFYNYIQLSIFTQIPVEPFKIWQGELIPINFKLVFQVIQTLKNLLYLRALLVFFHSISIAFRSGEYQGKRT